MSAPIHGLILCGGASTRMGRNKAALNYHGQPESHRLFDLLRPACVRVYLSLPPDAPDPGLPFLADSESHCGPAAGIRRAFAEHPDAAWFVLACDMPNFAADALDTLLAARAPARDATAFLASDDRPHPLATIYEPTARGVLAKHNSPRNALAHLDVHAIPPPSPASLQSFDTPEQSESWQPR